ncbi:MAG: YggS family pyridoxal phosphate-dependent enzyme [Desulfobacterales bacterium]|nr:YggS family pyridoxal phosphate-dependent enzyme [Desulfobacterales bacterium]
MTDIKHNLNNIQEKIKKSAISCGRNPDEIKLIAVTKNVPSDIIQIGISNGITIIGESYIQEALEKFKSVKVPVSWHFIGHLQSNKAKYAVKIFDLIHSVDSIKLAEALNKEAKKIEKKQKILIQVNTSLESTKSGSPPDKALELVKSVKDFENIEIKGLMTMPPFFDDPENAKPYFKALVDIGKQIQSFFNINITEFSMGMSGDFEAAIQEGATMIRIGTAIFGERE